MASFLTVDIRWKSAQPVEIAATSRAISVAIRAPHSRRDGLLFPGAACTRGGQYFEYREVVVDRRELLAATIQHHPIALFAATYEPARISRIARDDADVADPSRCPENGSPWPGRITPTSD